MPNVGNRKYTAISCKPPTLDRVKLIRAEMTLMGRDAPSNDQVLATVFDHWEATKHLAFRNQAT